MTRLGLCATTWLDITRILQKSEIYHDHASVQYGYDPATKRLSTITTDSTVYQFVYDGFGNTTNISAGSYQLASYEYNAGNGKLNTLTYGNGKKVKYVYDVLDRIQEMERYSLWEIRLR